MQADIIFKYFPNLSLQQRGQFELMAELYKDWNAKVNLVSRKDIEELYLRHVLHSLGIAKIISFLPGSSILDVGTGGGFPGVPLAILYPETRFTLVDAIGKKIKVVNEVISGLQLGNSRAVQCRVEEMDARFDFVISRAVAAMPTFVYWVKDRIKKKSCHSVKNGIFYLKGGDLSEELKEFPAARISQLSDFFEESFFETKKVVYLPGRSNN